MSPFISMAIKSNLVSRAAFSVQQPGLRVTSKPSVPNTASSRVPAHRPVFYQSATLQRYTPTPSKRIMSSQSRADDEEQRKRERIWRQDRLDRERYQKIGYLNGICRDVDQEDWERGRNYSSSSGEQSSENSANFVR